jgi:hypothetical protein
VKLHEKNSETEKKELPEQSGEKPVGEELPPQSPD